MEEIRKKIVASAHAIIRFFFVIALTGYYSAKYIIMAIVFLTLLTGVFLPAIQIGMYEVEGKEPTEYTFTLDSVGQSGEIDTNQVIQYNELGEESKAVVDKAIGGSETTYIGDEPRPDIVKQDQSVVIKNGTLMSFSVDTDAPPLVWELAFVQMFFVIIGVIFGSVFYTLFDVIGWMPDSGTKSQSPFID